MKNESNFLLENIRKNVRASRKLLKVKTSAEVENSQKIEEKANVSETKGKISVKTFPTKVYKVYNGNPGG